VPTKSWGGKSAVFRMYSALTSHGYSKSIKAVRRQRNLGLGQCRHLPIHYFEKRGRDRMVFGFTTTFAIGTYHHWCCEFDSRSGWGVQHYVIKFVSDLRQVSGFLWDLRFPPRYNWNIVASGVKLHKTKKLFWKA
jgi:hypothetical protein